MNPEKIDIPDQFDLIDKYEDHTMVKHILEEDLKFLKLFTSFTGTSKWSYIINDGVISQIPLCYYYFVGYKYIPDRGKRILRIGFIFWHRKIYATINIEFNVYPRKSVYVNPHKAWCLPYSDVTYNMKIIYRPVGEFDEPTTKSYIRSCTLALMDVTRICVKYDVLDLRPAYFRGISSYPSYRLANLLVYNQKLVIRVRKFMSMNCNCSFKTSANIPYCGCETLCSEIIPKNFPDAGRMCSNDVLFSAT